jgi:hypothetical protein
VLKNILKDESGSLSDMVWVVGAALVVAVIIIAINGFAPGTVQAIWTTLTDKIQTMLSNIS